MINMPKSIDLTGQKFGRLTVIKKSDKRGKNGDIYWFCKCECGLEKEIRGTNLKKGKTNSCGCWSKEKVKLQWQDEEYRQRQSEKLKKQWENKEFREMQTIIHSEKKGDKSHRWQGGITSILNHLRKMVTYWNDNCKQQVNYTCQLTGKRGGIDLQTHHLKAFSTIVKEAHELHNIQIKENVGDYTEEEVKLLEEYVGSWHKDSSNGIVLCKEVHGLFHQTYGYKNNTPEQFEEFKERYLAGEFEEILK